MKHFCSISISAHNSPLSGLKNKQVALTSHHKNLEQAGNDPSRRPVQGSKKLSFFKYAKELVEISLTFQ